MGYVGLTGFLGNDKLTPEQRARQLLTHWRAIPYEDAVSALTELLCGFQDGVKDVLRPVVEEFKVERSESPEIDARDDDDRIVMTLPLAALRRIQNVYEDIPGSGRCQTDTSAIAEAVAAEREACAEIVDNTAELFSGDIYVDPDPQYNTPEQRQNFARSMIASCAAAIRSRSQA